MAFCGQSGSAHLRGAKLHAFHIITEFRRFIKGLNLTHLHPGLGQVMISDILCTASLSHSWLGSSFHRASASLDETIGFWSVAKWETLNLVGLIGLIISWTLLTFTVTLELSWSTNANRVLWWLVHRNLFVRIVAIGARSLVHYRLAHRLTAHVRWSVAACFCKVKAFFNIVRARAYSILEGRVRCGSTSHTRLEAVLLEVGLRLWLIQPICTCIDDLRGSHFGRHALFLAWARDIFRLLEILNVWWLTRVRQISVHIADLATINAILRAHIFLLVERLSAKSTTQICHSKFNQNQIDCKLVVMIRNKTAISISTYFIWVPYRELGVTVLDMAADFKSDALNSA